MYNLLLLEPIVTSPSESLIVFVMAKSVKYYIKAGDKND